MRRLRGRLAGISVGGLLLLAAGPALAAVSPSVSSPTFASPRINGTVTWAKPGGAGIYVLQVYLFKTASATGSPCNTSSSALQTSACGDKLIGTANSFTLTVSTNGSVSCGSLGTLSGTSCTYKPYETCSTYTSGSWDYYWRVGYTASSTAYVNGSLASLSKACAS